MLVCMCVCNGHMHMYVHMRTSACGGQKRVSDHRELELQAAVGHLTTAENPWALIL